MHSSVATWASKSSGQVRWAEGHVTKMKLGRRVQGRARQCRQSFCSAARAKQPRATGLRRLIDAKA